MSRKRATAEDVYTMEDSDYRDLMREDLIRARQALGKSSSHAGSVLISMILLLAGAAVILHHMGLIELSK